MDVSVVITCWNGRKILEKNFPKVIEASKNPKNKIKEVLVVDDGSSDDSAEYVSKFKVQSSKFKVKLVKHERNLGYSATCNTGVREAKGELVVILNLDVAPSPNFLESVLPFFEDEKVFSVSFNEGKYGPGKLIWKEGFLEIIPTDIPSKTSETDWPSGGSTIFKKRFWKNLQGMDNLFLPFYFEDIDLGIRARKQSFKCLWEPRAKVIHEHEETINTKNFKRSYLESIKQRNHLLLTWKNIDSFQKFFVHLFLLAKRCLFHPSYFKIVILAIRRRIVSLLCH